MPLNWTNGSLVETAEKVKRGLDNNSKHLNYKVRNIISNIIKININELQNEKYLLPIIFEEGEGTKGRKRLKNKMKGDIDDGCMRSIALTIAGVKSINAYIGVGKK